MFFDEIVAEHHLAMATVSSARSGAVTEPMNGLSET
jgi:hypothetical protein